MAGDCGGDYGVGVRLDSILSRLVGLALWALLMAALTYQHQWLNLANAPVLLILVSSIYSLLLPLVLSLVLSGVAVLMFNFQFVPPVGTLSVDFSEHGILLITIMGVSGLITYLLRRQKQIAEREHQQSKRTVQLMRWSEELRELYDPQIGLPKLHRLVQDLCPPGAIAVMGFSQADIPASFSLNATQREGFRECLQENRPMGIGTGRFDNLEDLYLPMRGRTRAYGVCLCIGSVQSANAGWVRDVQAMLDQMGLACERRESFLRAQHEREHAQQQQTRSLFLTSIAHDQRTPLASIMTSASTIIKQLHQLSKEEIGRYAELINTESQQVARLTDNTLTLARLSAKQVEVPMQAESAEDIVAAVFQRIRQRDSAHLPTVRVQSGLPLLTCNMVLIEQVLDNLIDNAIKHSGAPESIHVDVRLAEGHVVFEVLDRGQGLAPADSLQGDKARGLGIGLQLCHAVAVAHRGSMSVSSRPQGGCAAVFTLPISHKALRPQ